MLVGTDAVALGTTARFSRFRKLPNGLPDTGAAGPATTPSAKASSRFEFIVWVPSDIAESGFLDIIGA
jgi:hypothetical protein